MPGNLLADRFTTGSARSFRGFAGARGYGDIWDDIGAALPAVATAVGTVVAASNAKQPVATVQPIPPGYMQTPYGLQPIASQGFNLNTFIAQNETLLLAGAGLLAVMLIMKNRKKG